MTLYNALVKPHFNYCSLILENCSVTLQQKLPKLQNRAARVICLEHVWNTLPIDDFKTFLTIDDFKKKLRKNMINDENSMCLLKY